MDAAAAGVVTEAAPCRWGGALRVTLPEGRRFCVTALSLLDAPGAAAAGGQGLVNVWAEDAGGSVARAIGMLWPRVEPIGPVVPAAEFTDAEFVIRHDSLRSAVRLYGYVFGPQDGGDGGATRSRFLIDIDAVPSDDHEEADEEEEEEELEEEEEAVEEYELLTEEEQAERYDSDNGEDGDEEEEEEDHQQPPSKAIHRGEAAAAEGSSRGRKRRSAPLAAAPAGTVVPDGEFLGPARFAAAGNTAGFMRVAAKEPVGGGGTGGREILVLYRYTRFSRARSGRGGVEACRRRKLHRLRFAVPRGGDMAGSLAWAGASLAPLIYPALYRRELQDLWTSLAAPSTTAIPPHTSRLQVIVDAGILRREDRTAERMEDDMPRALEATVGDAWPDHYHVGMELDLPEPVTPPPEEEGDTRPAKRRRVAADEEEEEEECSVCLEPLESGTAAWPGCRHVFHGECVEMTLTTSEMCPLCRRKLSDPIVHKNSEMQPQPAVFSVQ